MDLYLIRNYQNSRRSHKEELLSGCAKQAGEDLEEINRMLFDIYANNSYFHELGGLLTELEEFDAVYELGQSLHNRMSLEGRPHGFVIYYHGGEKVRYYGDNALVDSGTIGQIKEFGRLQLDADTQNWQWMFLELDGKQYGILMEQRDRVAMSMVYSFWSVEQSIREGMDTRDGEVFLVDAGTVLDELPYGIAADELQGRLRNNESRFQCHLGGCGLYGQKVKNTDLWICMAEPVTLWSYMNIPQLLLLLLTVSSLAGACLLYRYVRRELIVPLRDMIAVMKRIQEGEWDAKLDGESGLRSCRRSTMHSPSWFRRSRNRSCSPMSRRSRSRRRRCSICSSS